MSSHLPIRRGDWARHLLAISNLESPKQSSTGQRSPKVPTPSGRFRNELRPQAFSDSVRATLNVGMQVSHNVEDLQKGAYAKDQVNRQLASQGMKRSSPSAKRKVNLCPKTSRRYAEDISMSRQAALSKDPDSLHRSFLVESVRRLFNRVFTLYYEEEGIKGLSEVISKFGMFLDSFQARSGSEEICGTHGSSVVHYGCDQAYKTDALLDREVKYLPGGELLRVALVMVIGKTVENHLIQEPSTYFDSEQRITAAKMIKRYIDISLLEWEARREVV